MESVEVTVVGLLKPQLPEGLKVEPDQTVGQVVKGLGLDPSKGIVLLVNGHLASWDYVLQKGDRLELVQTVSGGL